MTLQYPLKLSHSRQPGFDNYLSSGNEEALDSLLRLLESADSPAPLYLWGSPGCGKSHLLLAACQQMSRQSHGAIYLSLSDIERLSPLMLGELQQYELVCIDDVENVCADKAWEEALFHLYNAISQQHHKLLIAAGSSPGDLPTQLPDLASRLMWGVSYHLRQLDDEGKQQLLIQMADEKGMRLSEDASRYLINRYSRNIKKLTELIDKLDHDSLSRQQKLTIPFLRHSIS
ncbi:MAG TPA: DnaA regulatory inactivator Hda [Gammaproteobacteria bacterium]|nr:DnaA regulatory inactivator Hda [Gammaproteobacteria bacterium]